MTVPEGIAIALCSLALSLGLIAVLSGFFASRDQAGVSPADVPGQAFRDLGHAHLQPGAPRPVYDSDPPTSGPHVPALVLQDGVQLSNDQLLETLEVGDVVIVYGSRTPPPGLLAFARSIAAPFSPQLADAGQAVIVSPRPGTTGLIGLAWAHMIRVSAPGDSLLKSFVTYWLGRGAPGR